MINGGSAHFLAADRGYKKASTVGQIPRQPWAGDEVPTALSQLTQFHLSTFPGVRHGKGRQSITRLLHRLDIRVAYIASVPDLLGKRNPGPRRPGFLSL
jgi:hypothetical protein